MWVYLILVSALFLGVYDVSKKRALRRNSVMWVLFSVSCLSCLLLLPFFRTGPAKDFITLIPKGILVSLSWISGLMGMKLLPLTTASTIKASRPVFVLLGSILVFGERLSAMQWTGVLLSLSSMFLLSRSSRREGIYFSSNRGILWMGVSVAAGVSSALYDKFAISRMDPIFVLTWSNLYIAIVMGLVLGVKIALSRHKDGDLQTDRFRWDGTLILTAVLIVCADAFYFVALASEGAMLSVISLVRRASVIVTFVLSAIVFREKNLRSKAFCLAVLLAGLSILVIAS